ncbi:MAG: hypothetical protein OXI74_10355 [Rhodospirillaceae bacterium]|nr:hypothetical protein [Rhodospirillaceae bacterium]
MIAFHGLRRTILLGVAGAVSTAVLLPGLALMRDTTGHDWYVAGRDRGNAYFMKSCTSPR